MPVAYLIGGAEGAEEAEEAERAEGAEEAEGAGEDGISAKMGCSCWGRTIDINLLSQKRG
ncbi:MAG: hypothetical protein F6K41_21085 [Symploca sp. SIO3E6]|nr:hypothetical protein [Caldora sp. SIO3E6]